MHDRQRPCEKYQRPWGGHCVDINLEDNWLERLNKLKVFDLINICEGHPKRVSSTATRYAHIYLRLKDTYLRGLIKDWETIRPSLLKEVHCLFQDGSTHLNFDVIPRYRFDHGDLSVVGAHASQYEDIPLAEKRRFWDANRHHFAETAQRQREAAMAVLSSRPGRRRTGLTVGGE